MADTGVRDRNRPGAHAQTGAFDAAAKIKVIEIEHEAFVEPHAAGQQRLTEDGKKNTVEQQAGFTWRLSIPVRLTARLRTVGDDSAQVLPIIPGERLFGDEGSARLAWQTPHVAGYPDNIEDAQCLPQSLVNKAVVQPDVVVRKEEDFPAVLVADLAVVHQRQAATVVGLDAHFDPRVIGQTPQRTAQRRNLEKLRLPDPGGADNQQSRNRHVLRGPGRRVGRGSGFRRLVQSQPLRATITAWTKKSLAPK